MNKSTRNVVRLNRKWEIQYGGIKTGSTYISACRQDRNENPTDIHTFSRSSIPIGTIKNVVRPNHVELGNPMFRHQNRKYLYLSL